MAVISKNFLLHSWNVLMNNTNIRQKLLLDHNSHYYYSQSVNTFTTSVSGAPVTQTDKNGFVVKLKLLHAFQ